MKHTRTGNRLDRDIHHDRLWCHLCHKWAYPTRKIARRVRKTANPGEQMDTFPCRRGGDGWHVGHSSEPRAETTARPVGPRNDTEE